MDEDDENVGGETSKVSIDASELHVLTDDDAVAMFDRDLGSGSAWASPLMQYRTTSEFQRDWKIEVGNWLERARQLGFRGHVLGNVVPQCRTPGLRTGDDPAHRNVTQRLAQAMVTHYLVGTGWRFHAWEPQGTGPRANGTPADVDVQLCAPGGQVVGLQIKASGDLGAHDNEVDARLQVGVRKAAGQLPAPAAGPAMIVVCAQRSWPLTADIDAVEQFIGSTSQYEDGPVLLHAHDRGEFATWPHVSGIVVLDHRRALDGSDYACVALQNPWALHPLDPEWFPHAGVLVHANGEFTWRRGYPRSTTFPPGTRDFAGTRADVFRMIAAG